MPATPFIGIRSTPSRLPASSSCCCWPKPWRSAERARPACQVSSGGRYGSVLWILAKPQNAPIGLLLGLFTFRLAMWTGSKPARVVAPVGSCAMFACAAFNVLAMPVYGRQANTYGVVFSGILADSKNPEADLRALGLDPQLARYSGTGAWTPGTYFPQMAASGVLKRVNTFTVMRFYLLRPARMWRRLHGLLPNITFLRRDWYGNFEPSAGLPPAAQSREFTLWSGFHEHILPPVNQWVVFGLAGHVVEHV